MNEEPTISDTIIHKAQTIKCCHCGSVNYLDKKLDELLKSGFAELICVNCNKVALSVDFKDSLDSSLGASSIIPDPAAIIANDPVNHPAHYTEHPSGIECIEITRHHNFNIGNAIKYLWRAGRKDSSKTIEDLRKAVWYINDEIKKLEK